MRFHVQKDIIFLHMYISWQQASQYGGQIVKFGKLHNVCISEESAEFGRETVLSPRT